MHDDMYLTHVAYPTVGFGLAWPEHRRGVVLRGSAGEATKRRESPLDLLEYTLEYAGDPNRTFQRWPGSVVRRGKVP
jgi:hypothetical protein